MIEEIKRELVKEYLRQLSKLYPNDMEFGKEVRKYINQK